MAKRLHHKSGRRDGPFISVNCAAIPASLVESELFGYLKGTFTGAQADKKGLLAAAGGGTLFLDEAGELPLELQAKLLQVLEERSFRRLGETVPTTVDFRLIAASNKDLKTLVREGKFRDDLYYRLNVVEIWVPPLRERPGDIQVMLTHYLAHFNQLHGTSKSFTPESLAYLVKYHWPGNTRELRNIVERLVVTTEDAIIRSEDVPREIRGDHYGTRNEVVIHGLVPLRCAVEEVERQLLQKAREKYTSTYQIAKVLGVNQSTVVRKLNYYGQRNEC